MAVVRYVVEIETTTRNEARLDGKLKREMELMYGQNVRVWKTTENVDGSQERIYWVNGE